MRLLYALVTGVLLQACSSTAIQPPARPVTDQAQPTGNAAPTGNMAPTETAISNALAVELNREYQAGTFAGVVLVTQQQRILLKTAYGLADRQQNTFNSAQTLFDMGSIAKTFTAAAVLQLVQQGKLQLADPLGLFFPAAPAALQPMTIAQLLGHQSGLDNFHNSSDFELMDKATALQRIFAMKLIGKPGEQIAYSNAAYTLLAAIVEQVSQQPFQAYVHKQILQPLQLQQTWFYQDKHLPVSALASGYGGEKPGSTTNAMAMGFSNGQSWALLGAGGMLTTLDDLQLWAQALQGGTVFAAGSPNLLMTRLNERWLAGSLASRQIAGETVLQMGGSTDYGYTALIQWLPARQVLIVLLLNAHNRKYGNATHHQLSRQHLLPVLLNHQQAGAETPGAVN